MNDVVYVYKENIKGGMNLKYSLRSLCNIKHNKVFIVGDLPDWVNNTTYIPFDFNKKGNRVVNVFNQIKKACQHGEVSEDFILFNDDYYVLKPIGKLNYYIRGKEPKKNKSYYYKSWMRTKDLFGDDFKSFCPLHTPIIYNKKKFLELFEKFDINKKYAHKSLYGNYHKISDCEVIGDSKVKSVGAFQRAVNNKDRVFLSTINKVERSPNFEFEMNKLFPNKSFYEK